MYYEQLINIYAKQKADLGISESYIADRASLSQPTVHRIFTGRHNKAAWNDMVEIGKVLGIAVTLNGIYIRPPEDMLHEQAEHVAQTVARITQATSQLEGQGLSDRAQQKLKTENIHRLLSGPRKKLWLED